MGLNSSTDLDGAISRTVFRAKLEPASLARRIQTIWLAVSDESRLEAKQRAKGFSDQVRSLEEKYDATHNFEREVNPSIPNHLILGTEFERVVAAKDNPAFPVGSADCLAAIFLIDHMKMFEQTLFRAPRIHDGQEIVDEYQRKLVETAKAVAKLDETDRKDNLAACYFLTLSDEIGRSSSELEELGNLFKLHPQGIIHRIVLHLETLKVDSRQIAAALDGDDFTFDGTDRLTEQSTTSTTDQWSMPMTLVDAGTILRHPRNESERKAAGRWVGRQIKAGKIVAQRVDRNRQSYIFALCKIDPAFHGKFKGIERA